MKNKRLIISHRGYCNGCSENTLRSFEEAIKQGVDYIEFDVKKTRDGIYIITHRKIIDGLSPSFLNYKSLNSKLGYIVPTLEDTLIYLKGKVKIDVDIHINRNEEEVIKLILKYFNYDNFLITSRNYKSLLNIKKIDIRIKTGLIIEKTILDYIYPFITSFRINRLIYFRKYIDFVVPNYKILNKRLLGYLVKNNYFVLLWVINTKELLSKYENIDCIKGFITDKPKLISI